MKGVLDSYCQSKAGGWCSTAHFGLSDQCGFIGLPVKTLEGSELQMVDWASHKPNTVHMHHDMLHIELHSARIVS